MKNTQNKIDSYFNKLYTSYSSTKVKSYDDCLVYYGILIGDTFKVEKELNNIIKEHNLPLIAKSNSNNGIFHDTVLVTIKED